jgi:hypothetical protein
LVAEVPGGLAGRQEKEEEINGNDGDVSGESADVQKTAARGFERRDRVGKQAAGFHQRGVGELADGRIGELALSEGDPVGVVAFDVIPGIRPEGRNVGDKGEQLVDEWR